MNSRPVVRNTDVGKRPHGVHDTALRECLCLVALGLHVLSGGVTGQPLCNACGDMLDHAYDLEETVGDLRNEADERRHRRQVQVTVDGHSFIVEYNEETRDVLAVNSR